MKSILIVDDSVLARRTLKGLLKADPELRVVGEAADGAEALEMLVDLDPDIILLDLEMPRLDGLRFLKVARLFSEADIFVLNPESPGDTARSDEALRLGATRVLSRPGNVSLQAERASSALLLALHRAASNAVH